MSDTLTMQEATTPEGELNAEEQDSLQVGEEIAEQEESLLAGKYKNAKDLESAYIELQKKLGEDKEEPEQEVAEEEETSDEPSADFLDRLWEEAQSEFNDETLKELSNMDVGELAKMHLEYRARQKPTETLSDQDIKNLKGLVGGADNYDNMMQWASQNLEDGEIDMFDQVMDKGDPLAAYFAVQALAYRYQDTLGVEGELLQGKAPSSSMSTFRSQAELVQAMSDPRYETDPAYRQDVIDKLERSGIEF